MKLIQPCPTCGKPAKIQAKFPIGNMIQLVYQCGHIELVKKEILNDRFTDTRISDIPPILSTNEVSKLNGNTANSHNFINVATTNNINKYVDEIDAWMNEGGRVQGINEQETKPYIHPSFFSVNGTKVAYPFQVSGIQFAESTQLNCLIADAMGLGKTIQALIAIKRNKSVTYPVGIAVKGSTLFQWYGEFQEWISTYIGDCICVTKRSHLIQGFNAYIFSIDMLSKPDFVDSLVDLNLKTIIIDEVQNFKDSSAKRSTGLIRLIQYSQIKYKIALSGTPIKNRFMEFFTILNILAPYYFRDKADLQKFATINEKGQYTRLNPLRSEEFKELTSQWIIRRERHEVLKNLPDLTRDYQMIELDDPNMKKSYNHTLDLFDNWLKNSVDEADSTELLGWLAKLRAITGQAKCKNAIEWTRDFLESSDESLAIGIQHHSVRDTLYIICEQFNLRPLKFSGEDSIYAKNDIVRRFTNGTNRLLIINSIAGGVGLNLQTCANALVLERQWNSADEEQFEARFHRDGQKKAVTITYMIAKGTIDEFFHDIVIKKRKLVHETGMGSGFDLDNDIQSLKEFAAKVVSSRI